MKLDINRKKLIDLAKEWQEIWKTRPFDNSNGLGCQGAFSLYYFLKEMDPAPEFVVECGTWRGFSTWVIKRAVPEAKVICSDPILASRQFLNREVFSPEYRIKEAEYTWQDFSNIEIIIPEDKRENAVVFFDDHQNKMSRLKQAIEKGFKHIIYDDNVPYKYTHTSFEYLFKVEGDESAKLYFSRYAIFPPIYSFIHRSGIQLNGVLKKDDINLEDFFEDRGNYSWVTKVEVSEDFFTDCKSSLDSEKNVQQGNKKALNIGELILYLKNVPLQYRSASHSLPSGLVISLTSYKERFDNLYLTLHSLLLQNTSPDYLVLWIAEDEKENLPSSVWELEQYGLSIRFCEDIRSYKKIIPTLREFPDSFIVTADDDIYYEPDWLKKLLDSWDGNDKTIVAHRAHKMKFDKNNNPLPYRQWKWQVDPGEPADGLIVPTGCGGVLYPPHIFHHDVTDVKKIMSLCPDADDLWLYWMASLNNAVVKRSDYEFYLTEFPNNTSTPLWHDNIHQGGNDRCVSLLMGKYGIPWKDKKIKKGGVGGFSVPHYWEARYQRGGTSGAGSYGRLASFKAKVINAFIEEKDIANALEFGCGDGNQLSLIKSIDYLGIDVSLSAVELCRRKFSEDEYKSFLTLDEFKKSPRSAELTLSLDVIYHLVDDDIYHDYMSRLFKSSSRYCIIYSANIDEETVDLHVRKRKFTDWVSQYALHWKLSRFVPNEYPMTNSSDPDNTSFADFYIFENTSIDVQDKDTM